jgi:hypothetical protein
MDNRLEQALRMLRGIRQRYETESEAGSGRRRSHTVQVALGYSDMRWIGAAIEALERVSSYELLVAPASGAASSSVLSSEMMASEDQITAAIATAKRAV